MAARRAPFGEIGNTHGSQILPRESTRFVEKAKAVPYQPRSPRTDDGRRLSHLQVVQYVIEIMDNLRASEPRFMASATYMGRQSDINEKMRAILVDWLVDVHLKFKLVPETLYLAASLIDRFLDQKVVTRSKLQLVGVVAMLIAAKYEEIYPPEIRDFIYISANTYSKDDILKMERLMFAAMDFNISGPTLYQFLRRALQVVDADQTCQHLALYISELALMDYKMLAYPPSAVAAACVYVARKMLNYSDPWNWMLEHYTCQAMADIQPIAAELCTSVQAAPQHKCQATRKKYAQTKYSRVTEIADMPGTCA